MARFRRPSRSSRPASGSPPLASVARPLLVFAAASLAAVALLGVAAISVLRATARSDAIREAKEVTRLGGEQIVEPALGSAVLGGDRSERLDRVVRRSVLRDPVVRVKVWTLDGRVVYSDEPRLVGRRFELQRAERTAVRERLISAEVSDVSEPENRYERRFGKLLEVYLPIEAPDGTRLLFEDYVRYSLVTNSERAQLALRPRARRRAAAALVGSASARGIDRARAPAAAARARGPA